MKAYIFSFDSASLDAYGGDIRKTSSDTNLNRFRFGSGAFDNRFSRSRGGSGGSSSHKRRLSAGSRACGKITGQVKKQLKPLVKKPIESVKGHLQVWPLFAIFHPFDFFPGRHRFVRYCVARSWTRNDNKCLLLFRDNGT